MIQVQLISLIIGAYRVNLFNNKDDHFCLHTRELFFVFAAVSALPCKGFIIATPDLIA